MIDKNYQPTVSSSSNEYHNHIFTIRGDKEEQYLSNRNSEIQIGTVSFGGNRSRSQSTPARHQVMGRNNNSAFEGRAPSSLTRASTEGVSSGSTVKDQGPRRKKIVMLNGNELLVLFKTKLFAVGAFPDLLRKSTTTRTKSASIDSPTNVTASRKRKSSIIIPPPEILAKAVRFNNCISSCVRENNHLRISFRFCSIIHHLGKGIS